MSDTGKSPLFDLDTMDLEGDCDDVPLEWIVLDEEELADEIGTAPSIDSGSGLMPPETDCDQQTSEKDSSPLLPTTAPESLNDAKTPTCSDDASISKPPTQGGVKSNKPTSSDAAPVTKDSAGGGQSGKARKRPWGPLCTRKDRDFYDQEPSSSSTVSHGQDVVVSSVDDVDDDVGPAHLHETSMLPMVILERIDKRLMAREGNESSQGKGMHRASFHDEDSGNGGNSKCRSESDEAPSQPDSSVGFKATHKTQSSSQDGVTPSIHKNRSSSSSGEKPSGSVSKPHDKSTSSGSQPSEKSGRHGETPAKTSEPSMEGSSSGKHSSHSHGHRASHKADHRNSSKSEQHSNRERNLSGGPKDEHYPSSTLPDGANHKDSSSAGKTETPNNQEKLSHSSKHDQRRDSTSHSTPRKEKPTHGSQGREEAHAHKTDHHQPLPNFHVPKLDRRDSSEGRKGKGLENRKQQSGLDILKALYEPPKVQAALSVSAGKEASRESLSQVKRSEEKDTRSPQMRRLEKLITSNIWGFELYDEETLCKSKTPGGPPQWLMSIAQLTADDLSQDEVQNLITLSVSSQWLSSKSAGKRFGKLTLLFDNTKSMKVAMKSLLQIKPGNKNQKVTLLRSRTKEKDSHTKDRVEFQLFTSGDADISSDTVCVEPSINHGHWKGKVNVATLLMENVPASLEREVQADILQVLFPFAYLIYISSPSKDSTGCNAVLKHRREETVSTHVNIMRSIFIAGRMQRIKQMGTPTPYRQESNDRRQAEHQESITTPQTSGECQATPLPSSSTPATASPPVEETQVAILLLLRTKEALEQDVQELMRQQGSEAALPSAPVTAISLSETKQQLLNQVEDLIKVKQVMELMVKGDFLQLSEQSNLPSNSSLQSQLSHIIAEGRRAVGLTADGISSGLQDREGADGRDPHPVEGYMGAEQPGLGTRKEGSAAPALLTKDFEMQIQTSAASSFIPGFVKVKQEILEEGEANSSGVAMDTAGRESSRQGMRSEGDLAGDSRVEMRGGLKRKKEPCNEPPQKHLRQSGRENNPRRNFGPADFSGRKISPAVSPGQTRGAMTSAQLDKPWPRDSSLLGDKDSFRRPEKHRPSSHSSRDSEGRRRERWYEESDLGRESRAEKDLDYSRQSGTLDRRERDFYLLENPDISSRRDPYLEDRRDTRVSQELDPWYLEGSRPRSREDGLREPTRSLMTDEPYSRLRASPYLPSTGAGRDSRSFLPPEERDPLLLESSHLSRVISKPVRDRDALLRDDHHLASKSPEYFDRHGPVEEEDRARYTSRSLRDYEEPPEYDSDRYAGVPRSEDYAHERQPGSRVYRGSEERDLPARERLEDHRRPRRTLLHGDPQDGRPAERVGREAVEGQPALLPLPPDPEVQWPEELLDRGLWKKRHPDDYGEQYAEFEQWEEQCREPPPPRRERKEGRWPRQDGAPLSGGLLGHAPHDHALEGVPPPAGLLGHAPPDHALQAAPLPGLLGHAPPDHLALEFPPEESEMWVEKPGLLGPPPSDFDPSGKDRPVREHTRPPRDRRRPPRDLPPREPKRDGLLGPGPEGYDADLPPTRRPGPGLLGEAPPEVYYESEDHHPSPWPNEGLLGRAPSPAEAFDPDHRPPPPRRRPRERTPMEAPLDSYDNPPQPPPTRRSGKARTGQPRPLGFEYEQEPPPHRSAGLLGAAPSETLEEHPPMWPREAPLDSYDNPPQPPPTRRSGKARSGQPRPLDFEYEQEPPPHRSAGLLGAAPSETLEEHPPMWPREGLLGRAPSDAYGHDEGEVMDWERGQEMEWKGPKGEAELYQENISTATSRRKNRTRRGPREEMPPPQRGPPLLATPQESLQYDEQQYEW